MRARSRVGEDRYRLLTNNCEQFCERCLRVIGAHAAFAVELDHFIIGDVQWLC